MILPKHPFIFVFALIHFGQCIGTDVSNWPNLAFDEGQTASLPCLPKGDANAYFWRKGKWFNVSENVASIVHGISDKFDKYEVLPDGTLQIANFSKKDEGRYFCRIASEVNECHGSLKVYLKVKAEALGISIEGCYTTSICLRNFVSPTEIKLSCSANVVSESMTLKWYNGTKELRGDVATLPGSNAGNSLQMINVIHVFVEDSFQLTCEADGFKVPRNMAIVQLNSERENISETTGDSGMASFVAAISIGVICVILAIVVVFLFVLLRKKTTDKPTSSTVKYNKNNGDLPNAPKEKEQTVEPVKEALIQGKENQLPKEDESIQEKERQSKEKGEQLEERNGTIKNLRDQLEEKDKELQGKDMEIRKKNRQLTEKDKELQGKDMEIRKKNRQLTQEQQQRQNLQQQVQNLPQMQQAIKKLQQKNKEIEITTERKNKQLQDLVTEIIELKQRALQNLTNESLKVAVVVKPEKCRWERGKLDTLSSKYTMVGGVTSNTPNKDLNAMTKYIVESTFDGGNGCIVIFGDPGSGVVQTLHGGTNVKGLINDISNQMFSLLEKFKKREFKVILSMNMCNTDGEGQSLTLHYPEEQDVFFIADRWENLKKINIKTEEELTGLTSKMAPNASHMNRQGFVRYMIEITISEGKTISGNLTIVSVIDLKHFHRLWTATQAENAFENLLFPILRNRDSIRFLIGHCHPEQLDGIDKTCKATETALGKITLPLKAT